MRIDRFLIATVVFLLLVLPTLGAGENSTDPNSVSGQSQSENDFFGRSQRDENTQNLAYRMILSVVLVMVFGGVAIYISRKLSPRFTKMAGKEVILLETTSLGNRKALHLVGAGGRKFLLGATENNITKIAELYDTDEIKMPDGIEDESTI